MKTQKNTLEGKNFNITSRNAEWLITSKLSQKLMQESGVMTKAGFETALLIYVDPDTYEFLSFDEQELGSKRRITLRFIALQNLKEGGIILQLAEPATFTPCDPTLLNVTKDSFDLYNQSQKKTSK